MTTTDFRVLLDNGRTTSARRYAPSVAPWARLILAHGAGAGHDHPFMVEYATALALDGVEVVTFNFPYMDGRRGAPDRAPVLETCLRTVVDAARAHGPSVALFIGGKSMGGRMATHVAAQGLHDLRGVITLGYPLHPPGQPDRLRTAHLSDLRVPWLIVQGERDTFGSPTELAPFVDAVPGGARLVPVSGADHSLTVRREPPEVTRSHVVAEVTAWMRAQTLTAPASPVS